MSFDLPADIVLPVHDVSIVLDQAAHPFELENLAAIDANWLEQFSANPALFDGRVALLSSLSLRDGVLSGRCHMVRFATFLYWRTRRPTPSTGHAYANAILVSADNALIAVRMGGHTANAGQVYFASGTFEALDFTNGKADPVQNMHREVMEETGLDLAKTKAETGYHVLSKRTGTALFRRYFLDRSADEIVADIRAHVASEREPEIEEPVVIRNTHDFPEGLAEQMPDLIRWHYSTPASR